MQVPVHLRALVLALVACSACCACSPVVRRPGRDRGDLWGTEPNVPRRFLSAQQQEREHANGYGYETDDRSTPGLPPSPPELPSAPAPATTRITCQHNVKWTVWSKGVGYRIADTLETFVLNGTPVAPEELSVRAIAELDTSGEVATPNLCDAERQRRYLNIEFVVDTPHNATYDALLDYLWDHDLALVAMSSGACGARMRYVETETACEAVEALEGSGPPAVVDGGTAEDANQVAVADSPPQGTLTDGSGVAVPSDESSLVTYLLQLLGF